MKLFLYIGLFVFFCWSASAQMLRLKVIGTTERESKLIDSTGFTNQHKDVKSIREELMLLSNKLTRIGFIENEIVSIKAINDSLFVSDFKLGNRTNFIHIYIGIKNPTPTLPKVEGEEILKKIFEKDTVTVKFEETENFLNRALGKLERKGFSLSRLQLVNFRKCESGLCANLDWELGKRRFLNDIVINGYENFSRGHLKSLKRLYKKREFNQEMLKSLYSDFNQFRFVTQTKFPEILFTKDTTKVYVYIEKAKPNRFDGLIGFANSENGSVRFNGYLDLLLINFLNSGEGFNLLWKSDGKSQTTFNVNFDIPYIFKSPLGIKANLNIFKQDSIFQNTKTSIELGYLLHYNSRVYIGRESTNSGGANNSGSGLISNFDNSFTTLHYDYTHFLPSDFLFPEKTRLFFKSGFGKRSASIGSDSQLFFDLKLNHNFYLNKKNMVNVRSQNFYLKSDRYFSNELYRFGGINSIRGFNENSLQAHFITSVETEYRYILSPSLYTHSVIDYGWFKDATTTSSSQLLGLGFGFGLQTKNGLLNLIYATGTVGKKAIQLNNAVVQMSFITNF